MAPSATQIINETNPIVYDHIPTGLIRASGADYASQDGSGISRQLIQNALKKRIQSIDEDTCEPGDEDAFFVADLGEVYRQHLRWKMNLKRVKPHYGTCFDYMCLHVDRLTEHSRQVQSRPSGPPSALRARYRLRLCLKSRNRASPSVGR